MKERLYYLGKPGDGFGWGVANTNLVAALRKFCEVVLDDGPRTEFDAPVFVPIADSSLTPLRKIKSAPRLLGYCFTEWPIEDGAHRTVRQYDVLFCGSEWNRMRLAEAGIGKAQVLWQGIDRKRFKPMPWSDRLGFVVFSGGKYEFRKAQDIVIAAMRRFMGQHADTVLLAAWHNPWEQSRSSMQNSWLIDPGNPFEGLPRDRVFELPAMTNASISALYAQSHIGLFPNRCEAGTNLVMCEYMACARPVIATFATGHRDVLNGGAYKLTNGSYDPAGWFNCNVSDVIAQLEHAYAHRDDLPERGRQCALSLDAFTWERAAEQIHKAAFLHE